jgi:hypothetical protein
MSFADELLIEYDALLEPDDINAPAPTKTATTPKTQKPNTPMCKKRKTTCGLARTARLSARLAFIKCDFCISA